MITKLQAMGRECPKKLLSPRICETLCRQLWHGSFNNFLPKLLGAFPLAYRYHPAILQGALSKRTPPPHTLAHLTCLESSNASCTSHDNANITSHLWHHFLPHQQLPFFPEHHDRNASAQRTSSRTVTGDQVFPTPSIHTHGSQTQGNRLVKQPTWGKTSNREFPQQPPSLKVISMVLELMCSTTILTPKTTLRKSRTFSPQGRQAQASPQQPKEMSSGNGESQQVCLPHATTTTRESRTRSASGWQAHASPRKSPLKPGGGRDALERSSPAEKKCLLLFLSARSLNALTSSG